MIHSVKKLLTSSKVAFVTLLSVFAINANAESSSIGSTSSGGNTPSVNTLSGVADVLSGGFFKDQTKGTVPNVAQGFNGRYEYKANNDGVSFEAAASARHTQSFSKFINTSNETITVANISAGVNGGISLGCDGLDMGLEALAQFDLSNLFKHLPKYITTKLATEALAQIYATPLISAVMDGLKAMQNFTAEFQQASCNMTDVMDRADEIKNSRINDCVAKKTKNGQSSESALTDCKEPDKIVEEIEKFQKRIATKESAGYSISKLLTSNGIPYGNSQQNNPNQDTYLGSGLSTGSLMQMFIPDIKFSANGGQEDTKRAQLETGSIYNKASTNAYNALVGIYEDVIKTVRAQSVIHSGIRDEMVQTINGYKRLVMKYGSQEVFADTSDDNKEKRNADQINAIKKQFASLSKFAYRTPKATTGYKILKVGPENGPSDEATNAAGTDFEEEGQSDLLAAGNECFGKLYVNTTTNTGPYKWLPVFISPEAALSSSNITIDKISDQIVEKLSKCKAINNFNLVLAKKHADQDKSLFESYINMLAAVSALDTTQSIALIVSKKIDDLVDTESDILMAQCKKTGLSGLDHTAVNDAGATGQPYTSCDQYVEQNKMLPEKIAMLNNKKSQLKADIENLRIQSDIARNEYNTLFDMYNKQ